MMHVRQSTTSSPVQPRVLETSDCSYLAFSIQKWKKFPRAKSLVALQAHLLKYLYAMCIDLLLFRG